ncbi:alkylmercury lyase family protein [Actinomadura kijaniata]|uniref:alkylmercury lyase family protein n=1 Tax=Actinomadura kijaniata TaxID=46161 RepID=UPI003F1DBD89
MPEPTAPEPTVLELTVLTVPDCPNESLLRQRLDQALDQVVADLADAAPQVRVVRQVVADQAAAARHGMHGSPTLLINGVDPFAAPVTPASLSCRLYPGDTEPSARAVPSTMSGAPSVAALRQALRQAVEHPVPPGLAEVAGRAGLGRLAPVEGGLRAVHQRVLRAFAATGRPPSAAELDQAAAPFGAGGQQVMQRLHAADFLRLDASGALTAAYPFSPTPTPHRVAIDGGPQVYAMCAIDALGIAAMLDTTATITSAEPGTGAPITVTVPPGDTAQHQPVWEPATAVVFYGQQQATCSAAPCDAEAMVPAEAKVAGLPVAADTCCGTINFFTGPQAATAWAKARPRVVGPVLEQRQAWQLGVSIFGPLLRP